MINLLLSLANDFEQKLRTNILLPNDHVIYDDDDKYEKILELLGLELLPSGISKDLSSSWMGSGSYAHVYKINFNGKPAVAKITSHISDIENIIKLFNLKNKLGSLNKHILNVYDIKTVKFNNNKYYIAIVELLDKLNPNIIKNIFSVSSKDKMEFLSKSFKTPIYLNNLAEVLSNIVKIDNPDLIKKLKNIFYLFLSKIDSVWELSSKETIKDLYNLYTWVMNKYNIKKSLQDFYFKKINDKLMAAFSKFKIEDSNIFPEEHELEYENILGQAFPENKSIIALLYKLKEKNIFWSDLWSANLMQRPGTKEIVISDPGLFSNS